MHEGHAAGNVGDADVVVVSSAVRPTNPEIVEAERRGIPVIPRAEMLAELMRLRFAIAVAGLARQDDDDLDDRVGARAGGLDPTAVIGGRLSAFGSNARLGRGEYMVAEADESDRSFLMLWPSIAVMTNIDHEHMESYGSFDELQQAFADFANKVPFYGSVVACADDPNLAPVLPRVKRRVVTYGLDEPAAHVSSAPTSSSASFGGTMHRSIGGARDRRRSCSACWSWRCPDGTTCRTPWRRWPSATALGVDFDRRRRAARLSRAPSGDSSATARPAACWSSTTTAITRPRSPRCWRPRGPRSAGG